MRGRKGGVGRAGGGGGLSFAKHGWEHGPPPPPYRSMSEADEIERLKQELSKCENLMKTGAAADDLIAFTKSKTDPFHPDFPPGENPWVGGKGSGGSSCSIL